MEVSLPRKVLVVCLCVFDNFAVHMNCLHLKWRRPNQLRCLWTESYLAYMRLNVLQVGLHFRGTFPRWAAVPPVKHFCHRCSESSTLAYRLHEDPHAINKHWQPILRVPLLCLQLLDRMASNSPQKSRVQFTGGNQYARLSMSVVKLSVKMQNYQKRVSIEDNTLMLRLLSN